MHKEDFKRKFLTELGHRSDGRDSELSGSPIRQASQRAMFDSVGILGPTDTDKSPLESTFFLHISTLELLHKMHLHKGGP